MNNFSNKLFKRMPLVGIMRNIPPADTDAIAAVYYRSGLTCLEITMNSPGAEETITKLSEGYAGRLNIGAGTVCGMEDLERALAAGAGFIVTPIINEEVIKKCVSESIPIFPGAYTPSEIYKAWSLGASLIKLFPSGHLQPNAVKEILAPLNFISLMPTGGVTFENFTEYFKYGAKSVGIGSHFFPTEILANQDWDALQKIYTAFVNKYIDYLQVT
jgi:2-dehydro-3-deoxyphosphogluconate aldolase/(4S)-4-hydroxy-2-oxoglutarate aldolase